MKKLQVWLFTLFCTLLVVFEAQAASVLDAATTTAIGSGFTDMQDTILGLLTVAWPYVLGVGVLLMTPGIVIKIIKKIGTS
jgi:hypothetical protein